MTALNKHTPVNKVQEIELSNKKTVEKHHKVYDSLFSSKTFVLLFSLFMWYLDHNFLYALLTDVFMWMGASTAQIMADGVTLLLNLIPIPMADLYLEGKYRLRKGAKAGAFMCMLLWTMLFAPIAGMRFSRMEANKSDSADDIMIVNAYGAEAAEEAVPVEIEDEGFDYEAFWNTLLLTLEPMVSSGLIFVLSLKSKGNVIDKEIRFLEKETEKKKAELSDLEAARLSMDADPEVNCELLVREDRTLLDHDVRMVKEEAEALKTAARQMLMAHLKDPSSTTVIVKDAKLLLES